MTSVIIKPGREKSLLRRHPWVFSGAIKRLEGKARPGETVDVMSSAGQFLARGAYSPRSQIAVRIWSFDPVQEIGPTFFRERLGQAIAGREPRLLSASEGSCRLVNGESDGLPGLVVDRYADFLVCQFLSMGVECWKRDIIAQLAEVCPCRGIYERSDAQVRAKEGLDSSTGALHGDEPPALLEIKENGLRFAVDLKQGHKTGFYLDQRENRAYLADYAAGTEMLNAFSYTGGFGVVAMKHGAARVVNIDSSAEALALASRNAEINDLAPDSLENVNADVFKILREYRRLNRLFDLVVLDPPKFAASASQVLPASRGYKDINMLAFQLLRPGGLLITFSCSGHIMPALFQKIVADAALDARREARIIRWLTQSSDHPVSLNFPEGLYLKGLVCRVLPADSMP